VSASPEHSGVNERKLSPSLSDASGFDDFAEIWVIDFEFGQDENLLPDVRCLVAQEFRSGRLCTYWSDRLQVLTKPPFKVDGSVLVITFFGLAELGCFAQLGWQYPENLIDLYAECRGKWNGVQVGGVGLIDAAKRLGVATPSEAHKVEMRDLAIGGGPYSEDQRKSLEAYCGEDVATTSDVFRQLISVGWFKLLNRLGQALLRGRYLCALADVERCGIPLDVGLLADCRNHWGAIKKALINSLDRDTSVYDGGTFKEERFAEYLCREEIPWPTTGKGHLDLKADTFKERSLLYPQIEPLRNLRRTLSQVREIQLTVGADGRNRFMQSPFGTITGRNSPSSTKAAFGLPRWLRGLVRPTKGRGLSYIDWSQQEFGIAAALSKDLAMQDAYNSGDPYLSFAKQAEAAPLDATKESHPEVRELYKTCVLAVQYQMTARGLGYKLGKPLYEAQRLLEQHRRLYKYYWEWADRVSDHAFLNKEITACFGWRMSVSSDTKPRTVANFQMQANGAEMLRIAVILGQEKGVSICATIHDALLIEAPVDDLETQTAVMKTCMVEASRLVLDGFELRSDEEYTRYPAAFGNRQGPLWELVRDVIEGQP